MRRGSVSRLQKDGQVGQMARNPPRGRKRIDNRQHETPSGLAQPGRGMASVKPAVLTTATTSSTLPVTRGNIFF